MTEKIAASLKLFLLALWLCLCYPPALLTAKLKKFACRDDIVRLCNKGILRIIGVRLTVSGSLSDIRPLLLVSNHTSYLDIPIITSCATSCLTPKSEIASWPVIGKIVGVSSAIFIDRSADKVVEMKKLLQNALEKNNVLCIFPEATTNDGLHLQPFKSGLFSLAEEDINGQALTVQPACITYTHISGLPITSAQWPNIAWYSDMELAPHAWKLFKMGPIKAEISFLEPVTLREFKNRKKLAEHCHNAIADKIQSSRSEKQSPR